MARVFATQADYRTWSGDAAAVVSAALLARASLVISQALPKSAVYAVDSSDMPTDVTVLAALSDATCAQVQWWDEVGDTTGAGAGAQFQSAALGSASYTKGYSAAGSNASSGVTLAPLAFAALDDAGLITSSVWSCG